LDGPIQDANQYQAAKAFHTAISAGDVTVKHEEGTPSATAPKKQQEDNGDDIPW